MSQDSFQVHRFDDIEMLEIPEYDSSSSETETISQSSSTTTEQQSNIDNLFESFKSNLELDDWLNTSQSIDFNFNNDEYKASIGSNNAFSKSYVNYVNSLYKIIETVTSNNSELELEEEPIGLIRTRDRFNSQSKDELINESFTSIIENLYNLLNDSSIEYTSTETESRLNSTLHILLCLQGNFFYSDIKNRPELLCNWINSLKTKPDDDLVDTIMTNTPIPYKHPQFWNTLIIQYITGGRLREASDVIHNSKFEDLEDRSLDLFNTISDFKLLLENYTTFSLKGQFAEWKLKACEFRDSIVNVRSNITDNEEKIILSQIHDLANVITGLPKTTSSYCDYWYEVYVCFSLFQVRDNGDLFKDYYKLAIQEKPPAIHNSNEFEVSELEDQTFVNILEESFLKVLQTLYFLEPATAAYVAKLLELKQYFNGYYSAASKISNLQSLQNKRTISEYFLTLHAYKCLNVEGLTPVGIGLLLNDSIASSQSANVERRNIIADVLPRYKFQTNDDLEWALTICAKLSLTKTAKQLYYASGVKSLSDGYIFEALNMLVNCFDPTSPSHGKENNGMKQVHHIAWDIIFQDSLINNRPFADDLINNIVSHNVEKSFNIHPVIRQCLSPYAVLAEFFRGLENNIDKSFSKYSKLNHLLRFNYLPKKFYPLLLCQFLPVLFQKDVKFQLPDLVVIIELLDNYETTSTEEERKEAESLYAYAINHREEDSKDYDWRKVLDEEQITIPSDVNQVFITIRGAIVAKIAQVYITN
ncbi:protein in nuclear pore complex may function in nuclear envelope integrity may also be [Scheffersomyces coipomensis]|uniref:protein in nuclear pore complex may function in nuclear envelope integrity may also be n=1 Tax=Scheffersomyces coipomensis TaxID=1788519 RepID=UPI00315D10AA